jgi:hypothetical protein
MSTKLAKIAIDFKKVKAIKLLSIATLSFCGACFSTAQAATTFYGPTPYLSFSDSPFASISLQQFYLETFESGKITVPGVAITNNQPGGAPFGIVGPGQFEDSVDADDGTIDGLGQAGHSYANLANQGNGSFGISITFNPTVLGGLPTYAGLVWTDGSTTAPTVFEAFDALGNSLGTIGPVKIGDNSFAGTTAEDRFFGVSNSTGISKITIRDPGSINSLEIDHLQYGLDVPAPAVPEPSSLTLLAIGLVFVRWLRRAPLGSPAKGFET